MKKNTQIPAHTDSSGHARASPARPSARDAERGEPGTARGGAHGGGGGGGGGVRGAGQGGGAGSSTRARAGAAVITRHPGLGADGAPAGLFRPAPSYRLRAGSGSGRCEVWEEALGPEALIAAEEECRPGRWRAGGEGLGPSPRGLPGSPGLEAWPCRSRGEGGLRAASSSPPLSEFWQSQIPGKDLMGYFLLTCE